jgi:hypothetical protein
MNGFQAFMILVAVVIFVPVLCGLISTVKGYILDAPRRRQMRTWNREAMARRAARR